MERVNIKNKKLKKNQKKKNFKKKNQKIPKKKISSLFIPMDNDSQMDDP
jgi:hypothetical protein